ncbi:MAG: hypothetical protein JNL97_11110, partial [Verrucomicrobiales bacterium]|nr:hypothetical protein [Verrucomicrobiales bacterium]
AGPTAEATGSNRGATVEPSDFAFGAEPARGSVWWVWEAPADGRYEWSTEGSDFDTLLGILAQRPGDPEPNLWSFNDDAPDGSTTSRLRTTVVAGTRCYVAVDGFGGDRGTIRLRVRPVPDLPAVPVNDAFADAAPLGPGTATARANNTGAGTEPDEPPFRGRPAGATLWWRWKAARTGPVLAKVQPTLAAYTPEPAASAVRIGVYRGTRLADLVPVAESQLGGAALPASLIVRFEAVAGEDYYLRATSDATGRAGEFFLGVHDGIFLEPVRLDWLAKPTGSRGSLRLRTPYLRVLAIESSPDLRNWTEIWRDSVTNEAVVDVGLENLPPPRFLRAISRD